MVDSLSGNVLVAQSGGPTSVINSSLAGVITESLNYECVGEIYGGLHGLAGILREELIDLAEQSQQSIRALRFTPGSALGSCRYKMNGQRDYDRVLEVLKAHKISYFFYIGGNDSQHTASEVARVARQQDYPLRVIGIPKTVDNDLAITNHCPGYGSVAKYMATTVREIALDNESMGQHEFVSIVEAMGRNAGWITAAATLAKRSDCPDDAPHILLLPEVPFKPEGFLMKVQEVLRKSPFCLVVVGEGVVDEEGNYLSASAKEDAFGHQALGGAGNFLKGLVERHLEVKVRISSLGIAQRAAGHCISKTDSQEAFLCGQAAVKAALAGQSDKMVTLVYRQSSPKTCDTALASLSEVACTVKKLPENWIAEDGFAVTHPFVKYALPLIEGEIDMPREDGLPAYAYLDKKKVDCLLSPYLINT